MTRRRHHTHDNYQNFAANVGYGTNNLSSFSTYGFNPITRQRQKLDFMYRGSWIIKAVVDSVADDMTRQGIDIQSDLKPDEVDIFMRHLNELQIWQRLTSTIKWARLYGGAVAVLMIEGHRLSNPLTLNAVGPGDFKGLLVLDRWMLQPFTNETVQEMGPSFGEPVYYSVIGDSRSLPNMKIHHSRVLRFDGLELPYYQRMSENGWGLSVIEPMYDRLIAFDSATVGTGQLVYKAYQRNYKVKGYREVIAAGGKARQALEESIRFMRLMQSMEGITLMDAEDTFESHAYSFGGLSDVLIQLGQQVSGATNIPLTRLFGQSPAGMNATGESDMRNYYDMIKATQEARLRGPLTKLLQVAFKSKFRVPLPQGSTFTFNSLWQLSDLEKAQIAVAITGAVDQAVSGGILTTVQAMKELKEISKATGVYTNITADDIKEAEAAPPPMSEMGQPPEAAHAGSANLPQIPTPHSPLVSDVVSERLKILQSRGKLRDAS